MDASHTPNPQTLARIKEAVTPEFLERLTHYALAKLGQKWWRGVWNGKIPGGIQAGDLAVSAIEAVLIGDPDQGGRVWDSEKNPDLMNFLRDIIDSKASHLVERAENSLEREPHPADGESEGDFLDRKRDHRTLPSDACQIFADEEAANERLFFALLDEVKDDPLLPRILESEWDGIFGRAEIAATLGVDANAITQARKRLDRILPQFREKHAHMNPFRSPQPMPDNPEQTPATNAVKALAHFLQEPDTDELSQKEIRSRLSAAGVNMEIVRKRYETVLSQAAGRAVLAGARTQRQSFMARMVELRGRLSPGGDVRGQVRKLVQETFGERAEAAVAWRNFEHATDADLLTMLEDLTLLDELEKDDTSPPPA